MNKTRSLSSIYRRFFLRLRSSREKSWKNKKRQEVCNFNLNWQYAFHTCQFTPIALFLVCPNPSKNISQTDFSIFFQDCDSSEETIRQRQCAHFNRVPFTDGQHYFWRATPLPAEPCALYCDGYLRNATGALVHASKTAVKLQDWVVDGTGCSGSAPDTSLCINNKCMVSALSNKNVFMNLGLGLVVSVFNQKSSATEARPGSSERLKWIF